MRSDKHRGNASIDSWLDSHKEEIEAFQETYHFSDQKEEDLDELEELEYTESEDASQAESKNDEPADPVSKPEEPAFEPISEEPVTETATEKMPEDEPVEEPAESSQVQMDKPSQEVPEEESSVFKHVEIPDHEKIQRRKAESVEDALTAGAAMDEAIDSEKVPETVKSDSDRAKDTKELTAVEAYDGTEAPTEKLSRRERRRQAKLDKLAEKELEKGQMGFNAFDEEAESPKRSRKKAVWIAIISILVIAASAFGIGYMLFHHTVNKMDVDNVDAKEFDIDPTVKEDLKNYTNIAILGVDARKNEKSENSRSDAIIVMTIDNETKEVQVTSVMRDSYLKLEGPDGTEKIDKITHAHAFGGPVDTCRALNRNLDLNISQYLVFNWQAVADTVDALGGVTVDIQANEINDLNRYGQESADNVGGTYTPIYETGKQTLNGAQAVTYCRIRKTSGGDTGRGNRFKKVMTALIHSAGKMDASKLQKIANDVLPEINTNMKSQTMLGMLLNVKEFNITKSRTWPETYQGGLIGGVWYAVPVTLESNTQWLHEKLFNQKDYQLTDRSKSINDEIISASGYSEPKNANEKADEKEANAAANTN